MINRRQLIGTIGFAATMQAAPAVRDRFLGVWKLISYTRKRDGSVDFPYGESPVGRITYDKAGRMSAQLMRSGRHGGPTLSTASLEELREVVTGFTAYFGTFDIDESTETVIHHVQASLTPSWVGTDLKRTYRFNANRLILATGTLELTWEREPD